MQAELSNVILPLTELENHVYVTFKDIDISVLSKIKEKYTILKNPSVWFKSTKYGILISCCTFPFYRTRISCLVPQILFSVI